MEYVEPVPVEVRPEVPHAADREEYYAWWQSLPWPPQGDTALLVVWYSKRVPGWTMDELERLRANLWPFLQNPEEAYREARHIWWTRLH
jgi:hypothetical protein